MRLDNTRSYPEDGRLPWRQHPPHEIQEMIMLTKITAAAAAMLTLALATGAHGQAAVQEPGAYAFYHPDGDLLHAGMSPAPANAMAAIPFAGGAPRLVLHHKGHIAR
jgi:hypothetical protein